MSKTNFDLFLEEQLRDLDFAERFKRAGEAWDVALQIAALREKAGLSQRDLARKLKTSQQQISPLESPAYAGHSLSMLRRVAKALLDLADRFGEQQDGGLEVHHDLTQEELAQLVGASRETVNKALADFSARGWLQLHAKSVLILDRDRLARRAR